MPNFYVTSNSNQVPSEVKSLALARVYQFILSLPDPRNTEPESEDLGRSEDSGSRETLSFNLEDEGCEL